MKDQEQFVLRLRKGTPLDKMLRATLDKKSPTPVAEIAEIGGAHMWSFRFSWMAGMFDNISVSKTRSGDIGKVSYFDLHPDAPIPVSVSVALRERSERMPMPEPAEDEESAMLASAMNYPRTGALAEPASNIRWPDCPPMIESQTFFREPSWYKTMRAMVRLGKHIALAGAPGTGKDTAVIQLASDEGHPLVTIGGDAGFRRRDLVGQAHISNGSSYLEVAEYAAAVTNGWWVLLTEVNAADADALMFINSQLAAPYIVSIAGKAYPVHPDFRLFISYNPGLIGTKPLPQSFKDRFYSITVPWFTEGFLKSLLIAHGMPDDENVRWTKAIMRYAMMMWNAYEAGQLKYQITSRRLIDAVTLMNNGLADNVAEALRLAVVAAIDSPIEAKVAERVLVEMMRRFLDEERNGQNAS
jgi:MoxR-like ATPase